jgi:hypothetical protein
VEVFFVMSDQAIGKRTSNSRSRARALRSRWVWISISALAVLAVSVFLWWSQDRQAFVLEEGSKQLVVLIRSDQETVYRIRYAGRRPVNISSILVMLQGQLLHVDPIRIVLAKGDQEIVLAGNKIPAGTGFSVASGEVFDLRVTYRGQTLGGNYLYGFRIGYQEGERERTTDLVLEREEYVIVVE